MQLVQSFNRIVVLLLFAALFQGCTVLTPDFEEPSVQVTGLEPLPANRAGDLRFRIRLRVDNPNSVALSLSGLYYTLDLAGHEVVTGTARDLPQIPAYGSKDIAVEASANLMGSFMAAAELMSLRGDTVPYSLEAKLGLERTFPPSIRVRKDGEISLNR
ncbi:LEA type 2 family protein [Microbulbifer sp. JSM ZJ756]|uniref:LEA type 2 family protein n=1 Tax=Microbulbifer sp. JSM ZJ756 TaxID=3376191 RepID=UPI00379A54FD